MPVPEIHDDHGSSSNEDLDNEYHGDPWDSTILG